MTFLLTVVNGLVVFGGWVATLHSNFIQFWLAGLYMTS